ATASAALKRVETELGARLFERTTRSMRPTEAGQRYLGYARQALEALDEGAESLGQDRTELSGPIRIAATSDLGRHILRPWLDAFCDEHPGVRITLVLGDRLSEVRRRRGARLGRRRAWPGIQIVVGCRARRVRRPSGG
ncbi:LysR family transcriptional regulator, partial [Escherichia coli]|nr:LysR family transcriptional regulator [Escherichia coli]